MREPQLGAFAAGGGVVTAACTCSFTRSAAAFEGPGAAAFATKAAAAASASAAVVSAAEMRDLTSFAARAAPPAPARSSRGV